MLVADAQRDIRTAFVGGFVGQLVSGIIWLISAALATWGSQDHAILMLVVGGMFIFVLTTVVLQFLGYRGKVAEGNPLGSLGWQSAFVVPLCLPLIGAATLYRIDWFYPAFMIVVGAHYLSFVTLYGMRMFLLLAAILVSGGVLIGMYVPDMFEAGGWFTGGVLITFALVGRSQAMPEVLADAAADAAA